MSQVLGFAGQRGQFATRSWNDLQTRFQINQPMPVHITPLIITARTGGQGDEYLSAGSLATLASRAERPGRSMPPADDQASKCWCFNADMADSPKINHTTNQLMIWLARSSNCGDFFEH